MIRMERAEVLKLYLIGGLSAVALTLSGLVYTAAIPVDDRDSQGTQYLLVGVLLGVIFGFFGGFDDVTVRVRRLTAALRRTQTALRVPGPSTRTRLFGHLDLDAEIGPPSDRALGSPPVATAVAAAPRGPSSSGTGGSAVVAASWEGGLGLRPTSAVEVNEAVARHEAMVLDRFMAEGVLTSGGPITDDDVRVMVATSVVSAELSERLLGLIDPTLAQGPCRGRAISR